MILHMQADQMLADVQRQGRQKVGLHRRRFAGWGVLRRRSRLQPDIAAAQGQADDDRLSIPVEGAHIVGDPRPKGDVGDGRQDAHGQAKDQNGERQDEPGRLADSGAGEKGQAQAKAVQDHADDHGESPIGHAQSGWAIEKGAEGADQADEQAKAKAGRQFPAPLGRRAKVKFIAHRSIPLANRFAASRNLCFP